MSGPERNKRRAKSTAAHPVREATGAALTLHARGLQATRRADPRRALVLARLARPLVEALLELLREEEGE